MLRKIALWNVSFSPSVRLRRTQSRLIRIGLLCALFSFPFDAWGQAIAPSRESQVKPAASTQIDYGMPERLGRQVAPTPTAPWNAPDLRGYTSLLKSAEPSAIDPQKHYELVELIDIAQRAEPGDACRVGICTPGRDWSWISRERILPGADAVGAWRLPE